MDIEVHNEEAKVKHVSLLNDEIVKAKQRFGRAIQEVADKIHEYETNPRQVRPVGWHFHVLDPTIN